MTHFALLDKHQYLNLTTYRKDGSEVTRPVWFAADGDKLYLITLSVTGKAKQIQNNPQVFVSPSDARGTALSTERVAGLASIHEKGSTTAAHADTVLNRKYGIMKWLIGTSYVLRRLTPVWIEIRPA